MPKLSAYKRELPYAYAPGAFPSLALLAARPEAARRLLVHSQAAAGEGTEALRARCAALGVRAEVADQALRRISGKENCYAAVVFAKYESTLSATKPHIVLHEPSDMGNLGTILRACLGFGLIDVALIRPAADIFDPRAVRASMGALFAMRVAYFDSVDTYRTAYPTHALFPFMLDGALPLHAAVAACPTATPYALVFGNEASGLPAVFSALGTPVRIPHGKAIDSLNLAIAVSIAAYAFTLSDFEEEPQNG